jgi:putative drug exporter of the RND superfamily
MKRTLERLGRTTARHPWVTIIVWIFAAGALLGVAQASGGSFVNEFWIPGTESQQAIDLAQRHFPQFGAASADVVWRARSGTLRDAPRAAAIMAVVAAFQHQPDVQSAADPLAQGALSADGRTAVSTVQYAKDLGELTADAAKRLDQAAGQARAAGVAVEFRGSVLDIASQPETSGAELIGVIAALVILLLAFGSVVAAGLPILVAVAGLAVGTALVLIAGTAIDIPTVAPLVAVMLGLGAGIDYALFVVTRFRHYLAEGMPKADAAGRAIATAGHAVLFAGATVVAAILGLLLIGIPFIGGMGVAAALAVGATMLSALTLLPALLGLLGHRVNAGRIGRRRPNAPNAPVAGEPGAARQLGRWGRWAQRVGAHRYRYAAASVLVLAVLAIPLLSVRLGFPDDGNAPLDSTQRKAYDTVSTQLGPGWNAPLLVVVSLPDGAGDQGMLNRLAGELAADPEVETVTPAVRSADGQLALMTAVPRHGPQDAQVSDLLHRIHRDLAPAAVAGSHARVYVGGPTALVDDATDAIGARLPWMVLAVLMAAALLLIAMFRAPLIALKAALMALLSIGAAYGVLVAVFQWGWGLSLLGIDQPVPIMSMVPMLLFAVLFGLSMDYEVFLLSSIKDEYDASGDPHGATRVGLDSTGRVITAAAAIMVVVFLSFVPINDVIIKMLGIGLATAVFVDVTVIRLVLAPAAMSILGHAAWRRFGWLARAGRRPAVPGPMPTVVEPDPSQVH